MYKRLEVVALILFALATFLPAQVGINNDNSAAHASAMLEVKSTDKGMLIPRMTSGQRTSISTPATGLLVFDTDTESFWFKGSSEWVELVDGNTWTASGTDVYRVGGNVGVNLDNPSEELAVGGEVQIVQLDQNTGRGGNLGVRGSEIRALEYLYNPNINTSYPIAKISTKNYHEGGSGWFSDVSRFDAGLSFFTARNANMQERMTIDDIGRVGIGETSPQNKLHVAGNIRMADGNQQAGYIITSDAEGDFSWVDPNDGLTVPDPLTPVPIRYQGSYLYVHPSDNATDVDWSTAFSTCTNLSAYGFNDWYLPTLNELNAMYKQSFLITGLEENPGFKYWSATELDVDIAYTQRLDYGGPDPDAKTGTSGYKCRCIRKN